MVVIAARSTVITTRATIIAVLAARSTVITTIVIVVVIVTTRTAFATRSTLLFYVAFRLRKKSAH
jgi:hypothetical protein